MIGEEKLDRWIARHDEVSRVRYSAIVWPWVLGIFLLNVVLPILAALALLIGVILVPVKLVNESACNQRASQLRVIDGDYRLLSDTCYLTLRDGRVIPADQYRAIQETHLR